MLEEFIDEALERATKIKDYQLALYSKRAFDKVLIDINFLQQNAEEFNAYIESVCKSIINNLNFIEFEIKRENQREKGG